MLADFGVWWLPTNAHAWYLTVGMELWDVVHETNKMFLYYDARTDKCRFMWKHSGVSADMGERRGIREVQCFCKAGKIVNAQAAGISEVDGLASLWLRTCRRSFLVTVTMTAFQWCCAEGQLERFRETAFCLTDALGMGQRIQRSGLALHQSRMCLSERNVSQ